MKKFGVIFYLLFFLLFQNLFSAEKNIDFPSFDGFKLKVKITSPNNIPIEKSKKLIIMIPGSGPQNMDEDLSTITYPEGTNNLVFQDISNVLIRKEFTTLRFNKRAYEVVQKIKIDPSYINSDDYKKFTRNPLKYTVNDVIAIFDYVKNTYSTSEIYILGHSEGTFIALQIANDSKDVKGVVLIGYMSSLITTHVFEQSVYRPNGVFKHIDKNHDDKLDTNELNIEEKVVKKIKMQMNTIDLDNDDILSLDEFMGANFSNIIIGPLYDKIMPYVLDQASYKNPAMIIKESDFKVLFLQGEFDNQTPAYAVKSVELLNKMTWKKKNIKFKFYPKLGHSLDERDNYYDIKFRKISSEILESISSECHNFFGER